MILVTGATGHVGRELIEELARCAQNVRAMTRRPETARFPRGVEVVRGDFDDPTSVDSALVGVDRVFLMTAQPIGSAPRPTHPALVAERARRAGVRHVVFLSVLAGGDAGQDPITRWSNEAEAAVLASGVPWTLLRPGRFMSNALSWAPLIRQGGTVKAPFAHRPVASIDPSDIAAMARVCLTEPGHEEKAYRLSGPEALTPVQEGAILAETLGRPIEVVSLSTDDARAAILRSGMPPDVVEEIITRVETSTHGSEVLSTVHDVTGRAPRTFADWAKAHVDAFR
jgi:uncharacterized protein YbjT (DUF2867 family)